jgi:tol-pal system protein YbgF
MVRFGFLMVLLLSSCATKQELVDLERQLQTTRGELAAVRKGVTETKASLGEQIRSAREEQRQSDAQIEEQMKAILSTVEAQQKALGALNSFARGELAAQDQKREERLKRLENSIGERISGQEKGYLASQGNLGTRIEELAAELKIVQGKLEENNNLLTEQGGRLDDQNSQASRWDNRLETIEANLKTAREAQSSQGEKLGGLEGQVTGLVKNWEAWREQANRALSQTGGLERKLGAVEAELRSIKEAVARSSPSGSSVSLKESSEPSTGKPAPSLPSVTKETLPSGGGAATPAPLGADEIYRSAFADYTQGSYDLAISGFRSYLSKYPKGTLAANAQYWLGECHYSQKRFDQAIAEFEAVANNYPGSQKVPSSLLKMGYSYLEMGNASKGKMVLGELVDKYPKTREAFLAKSRLANLK